MEFNIDITLLLGILSVMATVACAVMGALLHRKTERIKIMEKQLSEKRYAAYAKLYDFFYDLFKNQKSGKNANNSVMSGKLMDAKKELIMYGSDEVIFALNKYLSSLSEENPYYQFHYFLELMVLIRKDMCGKTKVSRDDILLNIMQDRKELEKFKEYKKNLEALA